MEDDADVGRGADGLNAGEAAANGDELQTKVDRERGQVRGEDADHLPLHLQAARLLQRDADRLDEAVPLGVGIAAAVEAGPLVLGGRDVRAGELRTDVQDARRAGINVETAEAGPGSAVARKLRRQ